MSAGISGPARAWGVPLPAQRAAASPPPAGECRRVLCVDDEPNVLEALVRSLSDVLDVETARSGEEALAKLEGPGEYAVVVSDMRMPGMNGAVLLAKVRTMRPDTLRILLTGHTDLQAAIAAVNEGEIFRFLTKPCPPATLRRTLEYAVRQHALVRAERELLEGTVGGIVKLLTDVLSLVSPGVFARASRRKALVAHVVERLKLENGWLYEVAALLSPIGCIALPEDLVARSFAGQEVTDEERAAFASHPETAFRLLSDIPRFAEIASIVRAQHAAEPEPDAAAATSGVVQLGATILRAAIEVEARVARGATHRAAVSELRMELTSIPAHILAALESFRAGADQESVMGLPVSQLTAGMICDEDVLATSGSVIVPKGTELGVLTLERLRKFALGIGVREPVRVRFHG